MSQCKRSAPDRVNRYDRFGTCDYKITRAVVAFNVFAVQGERPAIGCLAQGRVVNPALKLLRAGRLEEHAFMVHAAITALDAFAFNVLWHLLNPAGYILEVVQRRTFLHGFYVPAGFAHGAFVVKQVALAPEHQAGQSRRNRNNGVSTMYQCKSRPAGKTLSQKPSPPLREGDARYALRQTRDTGVSFGVSPRLHLQGSACAA